MDYTLIQTAQGMKKGDLLLKGGNVVDVFNGTVEEKDVLIKNGKIACCGQISPEEAEETVDVSGRYLLPGFIDAHIHIESSHMTPKAFGEAVLAKGTCAVIADPHEIVNVGGEEGLIFMLEDAKASPADIFFMIPSSIPATDKETAGAIINAQKTKELFERYPDVLGLGELMNVPGILYGNNETLAKIDAAQGRFLDGHFPQGSGRALSAYTAAGITSDHESVTADEAKEKLANGITVFLREGSSARNLADLLPAVNDHNHSRVCFCADDICASDIAAHGDILHCLRKAVANGLSPLRAVEMATINPARHYHLANRGAIAPGYLADIVAVENLSDFTITSVWKNGTPFNAETESVHQHKFGAFTLKNKELSFPQPTTETKVRVIQAFDSQLITEENIYPLEEITQHDIARLYVMERYGKNGNIGYALIEGFGLSKGAIASSVAHDSHNLLILATSDTEASFAAKTMKKMGGGMVVVENGQVKAAMELPVGGLMSTENATAIAQKEAALTKAAVELGITIKSPFMTLAFMALPVIPKLKLTDMGLFDVEAFDFTSLYL